MAGGIGRRFFLARLAPYPGTLSCSSPGTFSAPPSTYSAERHPEPAPVRVVRGVGAAERIGAGQLEEERFRLGPLLLVEKSSCRSVLRQKSTPSAGAARKAEGLLLAPVVWAFAASTPAIAHGRIPSARAGRPLSRVRAMRSPSWLASLIFMVLRLCLVRCEPSPNQL